jgi:hypothetical protein
MSWDTWAFLAVGAFAFIGVTWHEIKIWRERRPISRRPLMPEKWRDRRKGVTTTAPAEPQGSEGLKLCPPAKAYIVPADSTQIVLELNARIAELERERDQYKFDAGMSEARMHELEQQLSEETEAGKVRAAELQGRTNQLERELIDKVEEFDRLQVRFGEYRHRIGQELAEGRLYRNTGEPERSDCDEIAALKAALAASDALSEKRRNELVIHQWACHDFVSGVPRSVCPCCGRSKAYGHSEICSWARLARKT